MCFCGEQASRPCSRKRPSTFTGGLISVLSRHPRACSSYTPKMIPCPHGACFAFSHDRSRIPAPSFLGEGTPSSRRSKRERSSAASSGSGSVHILDRMHFLFQSPGHERDDDNRDSLA